MVWLRLSILDRLEGHYERAGERLLEFGQKYDKTGGWQNLARLEHANQARAAGRFDEARAGIVHVLRHGHQRADLGSANETIAMLGISEIAAGACARGVTLIGAASNVEGPVGTVHMPDVRVEVPIYLDRAREVLGEFAFETAWTEGKTMTLDQARTYGLVGTMPDKQARSEHQASN